jgi:WD40 repeat protein
VVIAVETPTPSPSGVPSSEEEWVFSPDHSLRAGIDFSNYHVALLPLEADDIIPGIVHVWNVESNERVTTLDFSGTGTSQILQLNYGPNHPIIFSPGQIDFTVRGDRLLIKGALMSTGSGPYSRGAILLWDIRQNQLITWEEVIPGVSFEFWLSPDRRFMFTSGSVIGLGEWSDIRSFNLYDVSGDDIRPIFSPPDEYHLLDAAFDTTSSFLVFASGFHPPAQSGVFFLDLRSFEITPLGVGAYSLELSGNLVAYVTYYTGVRELHLMDINRTTGHYNDLVVLSGWPDDIITYGFSEDDAYLWVTTADGTRYTLDPSVIFH